MARRRSYPRTVYCSHKGCPERTTYYYDTRREYDDAVKRNWEWSCTDHSYRFLSPTVTRLEWVSEPNAPSERFPRAPGTYFGSWGIIINEGMAARANDFPLGTRVRVTMEVVLPDDTIAS